MLYTSAVPTNRKESDAIDFLPSVAVAASILLRERCLFLNATQVMMAIVLKFGGIQVMLKLCMWYCTDVLPFLKYRRDVISFRNDTFHVKPI